MDKKTYEDIQQILSDAVWEAQKKIEKKFGIETDVDISWKTTKSIVGSVKGPKEEVNDWK